MRLRADQLAGNLNDRGLVPVYCISGDEPLQMQESTDLIRTAARDNGIEDREVLTVERGFDWNNLLAADASMSLFSSRKLIELRLGTQKPGREGGAALVEYASSPNTDNVLLITAAKIEKQAQQTKWYKGLDKAGIVVQVWPVKPADLPGWMVNRSRQFGKNIQQEAAGLIAQKVEGNLLAARQELEKLCLLVDEPEITVQHVMSAVNDSARYDIFGLIETVCLGKTEYALRMLRGLRSEGVEPISLFGALMWELRRICSMACAIESGTSKEKVFAEYRIWQQRKPAINKLLNRFDARRLAELLGNTHTIDRALKGAVRRDPWELLERFMLNLAGISL